MKKTTGATIKTGMTTSPWIILGSTVILLIVVITLAVHNIDREKRSMNEVLSAKGAALIRAVEAGARTGMMGMRWGGRQIQLLLEETGRLPDVMYIAVVDSNGTVVAHSDPEKIGAPFRTDRQLIHLGPGLKENHELVVSDSGKRVFEVHRHFRPLGIGDGARIGRRGGMMHSREMMGLSQDDWFGEQNRQNLLIVVGLDVAPFEAAIRQDIRTVVIFSVILLLLGFGGFVSLFWMQSYRTARRSLQDTSAFAYEVVAHLPVGLIATDSAGRITVFNEAAGRISGVAPHQAMGKAPDLILPEELCGLKRTIDNGASITEREVICRFAYGGAVPLSISATNITNEDGIFVGQVLILRDLREVRRLQDTVRRQEKLAALGGLAAGVAHEIRNPLSSIKGLATYFAERLSDDNEAKEAAEVMIQEVDRINRAVSELLDFARPTDLKRRSTELAPLIQRSLQLIQQEAVSKKIRIDSQVDEMLCPAHIDPDRISQCLLNIYINAIQAMPEGGTLTVRCTEADGDKVSILIGDTGYGITPEQRSKIFEPYFTSKTRGTGLGLAIVHKIVEAHQGDIRVESAPGKGTTMTLQLPCRPEQALDDR